MTTKNNLIDNFEFASYKRDYTLAFESLLDLLSFISRSSHSAIEDVYFVNPAMAQLNATRIASALLSMLSDRKFKVDWLRYARLIVHKRTISSIFRVSGFLGSSSSLQFFSQNTNKTKNKNEENSQIYKMLIVMGLDDHNEKTLTSLINMDPKISTPYVLSLLASYVVISEKEHVIREKLLAFGPVISQQPFDIGFSGTFSIAWMNCSYGEREDKHILKSYLNQMMKQSMEKLGFVNPQVKPIDHTIKMPKIVIIAESFQSSHAMYRCFANHIRQLQSSFETILITTDDAVDEHSRKLFDQCETFSLKETTFLEIADLVSRQNADILFYLSAGMAAWTLSLLPFRFAPIQILAPGHPATSATDSIDYMFCDELSVGNPLLYSEKILIIDDGVGFMDVPIGEKFPTAEISKNPEILRIAVASKSFKINAPFLKACQYINNQIERPAQWCFFVDEMGLQYHHARLEITEWLPNAVVIPKLPYNKYLEVLNECDVSVGTFPFGGTNTNVDLLRLGIPKVCMVGSEMHSRADAVIFQQFDIPSWLICNNVEDFCNAVIRLVNDNELRLEISESLLKQIPEQRLLGKGCETKTGFIRAIKWAWDNHQTIMSSEQRIIKPEVDTYSSV